VGRFVGIAAAVLLAGVCHARALGPDDVDRLPASSPAATIQYGANPLQKGELRLPAGKGPFPVAIVIHGGCWTSGLATTRNSAPLATALTKRGIATWNIEYRQLGDPGAGWPGTFRDWAATADHLRSLARRYPLDLSRVVALGHSAGAQAALWLAARAKLPADSDIRGSDPLRLKAVAAIDGPGDLVAAVGADSDFCRRQAIVRLMGGTPSSAPRHYEDGSPAARLPLGIPQFLIASQYLRPEDAVDYARRAEARGDHVEILTPAGADHFNIIAPGEPQFAAVEALILKGFK
jgi:acetyl esterase/lipase